MTDELSTTGGGLRRRLDEAAVLNATVAQLRKDLDAQGLPGPEVGPAAFESLRSGVLAVLEEWAAGRTTALSRAINRVDLTERQVDDAIVRGGLSELAGMMVLRCLQKVLIRLSFSRGT